MHNVGSNRSPSRGGGRNRTAITTVNPTTKFKAEKNRQAAWEKESLEQAFGAHSDIDTGGEQVSIWKI